MRNTRAGGKTFNLGLRVSLALRDEERETPWEQERSKIKADFAGASAPDSSLALCRSRVGLKDEPAHRLSLY